jgi:hypothetical protein
MLEQHPIILVGMPFEDEAGILSAGGDEYEEDHARLVDGLRATMGSSADANDSERARVACSLDISRDLEPVDITQVELIRQEIAFLEDDSEINMTGFVYVGSEGRHVHGGHTDDSGPIPQAFSQRRRITTLPRQLTGKFCNANRYAGSPPTWHGHCTNFSLQSPSMATLDVGATSESGERDLGAVFHQ